MEYTILNTEYTEDTIYTLVRYNIEGHIVDVKIPHFQPQEYSIMDGVINRYITEMYKIFPERIPPAPIVEESPVEEPLPLNENPLENEGLTDNTW